MNGKTRHYSLNVYTTFSMTASLETIKLLHFFLWQKVGITSDQLSSVTRLDVSVVLNAKSDPGDSSFHYTWGAV